MRASRVVWGTLGLLLAAAPARADVAITLGPLDQRSAKHAVQWVTVRNTGPAAVGTVYVRCTFFAGSRPLVSGTAATLGRLEPGGQETIEVPGLPAPAATRAECRAQVSRN